MQLLSKKKLQSIAYEKIKVDILDVPMALLPEESEDYTQLPNRVYKLLVGHHGVAQQYWNPSFLAGKSHMMTMRYNNVYMHIVGTEKETGESGAWTLRAICQYKDSDLVEANFPDIGTFFRDQTKALTPIMRDIALKYFDIPEKLAKTDPHYTDVFNYLVGHSYQPQQQFPTRQYFLKKTHIASVMGE